MTLDKLKTGECGRIISVRGEGEAETSSSGYGAYTGDRSVSS